MAAMKSWELSKGDRVRFRADLLGNFSPDDLRGVEAEVIETLQLGHQPPQAKVQFSDGRISDWIGWSRLEKICA